MTSSPIAVAPFAAWLRAIEFSTRPIHPESRAALDTRWAELPDHVKTPNQLLGRSAVGCEGTHGVFPKCNLTCTPWKCPTTCSARAAITRRTTP